MLNESTQSKSNSLIKTAAGMMILTLLSKGFGYIRELILAGAYGTSFITDAYSMAQSIPSIIFGGVFAALSTSYMPTYSNIMAKDGHVAGNKFTSQLITILFFVSVIALLLGVFLSDQLVSLFARNFTGETAKLTSFYLKIAFSYTIFSSISGILQAYMRYHGKFYQEIIIGYSYNFCVIACILISVQTSYYFLIFGIFFGFLAELIGSVIVCKRTDFKYQFDSHFSDPIKQIFTLAIPVFIGSSIGAINSFVDKTLASGLPEGSISALGYGFLGMGVVTTLTTSIIATIMYPNMTKAAANKDWNLFNSSTKTAMIIVLMIAIPCTIGIIFYNYEIIQVILERGAFDANSTALTSSAFLYYSLGLTFSAINGLVIQVYYSLKDTKSPVICSAIGIVINIVFNLILIKSMQHNGLALATSIAAFVNVITLNFLLRKKYSYIQIFCGMKKVLLILLSSIISIGLSYLLFMAIQLIWMPRMVYLAIALTCAVVLYFVIMKLFKVEEINLLRGFFRR